MNDPSLQYAEFARDARGARPARCARTLRALRGRARACERGMIRIYHTSDLHDRRGIVAPLRALREERPGLLFDCGDALRGSQSVYHRSEPIVAEMDAAGYDAQAIGNREFHYLFGLLRRACAANASPAGLHEPARYQRKSAALSAGASFPGRRRRTGVRYASTSSGS